MRQSYYYVNSVQTEIPIPIFSINPVTNKELVTRNFIATDYVGFFPFFGASTMPPVNILSVPIYRSAVSSLGEKNIIFNANATPSIFSTIKTLDYSSAVSISDFVSLVNSGLSSIITAESINASYNALTPIFNPLPLTSINNSSITLRGSTQVSSAKEYLYTNYSTLTSLVNKINQDWGSSGMVVSVDPAVNLQSSVSTNNLISTFIPDVKVSPNPKSVLGQVSAVALPAINEPQLIIDFNLGFANKSDKSDFSGVQVAFGGYEKDGVFYSVSAPNSFFEPNYNTFSPISFNSVDADTIYLLIRTRRVVDAAGTNSYSANESDYSGMVTYSNSATPYSLVPFKPTSSKYTSVWNESFGTPCAVGVPASATVMNVVIEDKRELESVKVKLINTSSEINNFGFLAVNRTNSKKSQTQSKNVKDFGLVLDNRGSWDILISPEASLELDPSGSISYLGSLYSRLPLNDDEGYDMEISSNIPSEIKNSLTLSIVPGHPEIWVLRTDYSIKKYLENLKNASKGQDCSIRIDIKATGRQTGIQGTASVTIYYDYTCSYDINLCDFYWNLNKPSKPNSPEIIQNNLSIKYDTLVGCENLSVPMSNNISLNVPILLQISNIPTFGNGNALLLVKSKYTPEVQGFYYPIGNELDSIEYSTCNKINTNLPLIKRLNKQFLLLPDQEEPITNVIEILKAVQTKNSYLLVKPQFQFPPIDKTKDLSADEVNIIGIGYVFKNWTSGVREDFTVIGTNLIFPRGIFTSPEINFCYKYYYSQNKT